METFTQSYGTWILVVAMLWTLPWKGISLWRSAQRGDKAWFIALLLINSLAILDIIYIFGFSKRAKKDNIQG